MQKNIFSLAVHCASYWTKINSTVRQISIMRTSMCAARGSHRSQNKYLTFRLGSEVLFLAFCGSAACLIIWSVVKGRKNAWYLCKRDKEWIRHLKKVINDRLQLAQSDRERLNICGCVWELDHLNTHSILYLTPVTWAVHTKNNKYHDNCKDGC